MDQVAVWVSDPSKEFSALTAKGFQIEYHSHASAILSVDFPGVLVEQNPR